MMMMMMMMMISNVEIFCSRCAEVEKPKGNFPAERHQVDFTKIPTLQYPQYPHTDPLAYSIISSSTFSPSFCFCSVLSSLNIKHHNEAKRIITNNREACPRREAIFTLQWLKLRNSIQIYLFYQRVPKNDTWRQYGPSSKSKNAGPD